MRPVRTEAGDGLRLHELAGSVDMPHRGKAVSSAVEQNVLPYRDNMRPIRTEAGDGLRLLHHRTHL